MLVAAQSSKDWETWLLLRARELKSGRSLFSSYRLFSLSHFCLAGPRRGVLRTQKSRSPLLGIQSCERFSLQSLEYVRIQPCVPCLLSGISPFYISTFPVHSISFFQIIPPLFFSWRQMWLMQVAVWAREIRLGAMSVATSDQCRFPCREPTEYIIKRLQIICSCY